MTNQQGSPEALRLANEFKLCNEYDSIPSITDIAKAAAELRRQHDRIAELEAVGAGGVQALSAAPAELVRLANVALSECHYQQGAYPQDWIDAAMRVCRAVAASPTTPALSAAPARPTVEQVEDEVSMGHGAWDMVDPQELIGAVLRLAASPTPPAEQQAITPETGNSVSAQGAAITSESGAVYAELPELTSTEINDACWAFVEAMPHSLPGPIWNGLKPAVYAAICKFLQAAPKAAPSDIAKLRHLYANLKNGGVRDTAQAKRIADGLLAPIIESLEQAAPKAAPVKACVCGEPQASGTVHRVDGPCYVAAPQQEAQEPGEIDRLRAALVYTAFALHGTPQYMLADGITLIDGDTVQVSRDGWKVQASINPLRQSAQPAPQPAPVRDYPPLPKPDCPNIWGGAYSKNQMHAYVDADRAALAARGGKV